MITTIKHLWAFQYFNYKILLMLWMLGFLNNDCSDKDDSRVSHHYWDRIALSQFCSNNGMDKRLSSDFIYTWDRINMKEQNAQANLKRYGQVVYGNISREEYIWRDVRKEDDSHSQQIKLNNFDVSLCAKRKEVLNPVSTVTEAGYIIPPDSCDQLCWSHINAVRLWLLQVGVAVRLCWGYSVHCMRHIRSRSEEYLDVRVNSIWIAELDIAPAILCCLRQLSTQLFYFVMWMQQSRICILIVLQEKPFCVQISFVFHCF